MTPLRSLRGFFFPKLRVGITIAAWLLIAVNIITILGLFVFESEAAQFTSGGEPVQFYRSLRPQLLEQYGAVFGIAHNSGDDIDTTVEALGYGADVVEVDVIMVGGELYAAHQSPLRFIGERFFRGPTLAEVWGAAAQADVVKLDLKDSSPDFLETLVSFLNQRREHEVMVVTRSPEALKFMAEREPRVFRFISIPDERRLKELLGNQGLLGIVDGVTIKHNLLTTDSVAELHQNQLIIFAWTVNDLDRVNELVTLGVHGIITDNLAVMALLSGTERREVKLAPLRRDSN